jgi:hypothetical protein
VARIGLTVIWKLPGTSSLAWFGVGSAKIGSILASNTIAE